MITTGASELTDLTDPRVFFVADYVLKTFGLKGEKWSKMYNIEENKIMMNEFFEKTEMSALIFILNSAGTLQVNKLQILLNWYKTNLSFYFFNK